MRPRAYSNAKLNKIMKDESPIDFLKRLKTERADTFIGSAPSADYLRVHSEQQKETGSENLDSEKFLDQYFNDLFRLIVSTLEDSVRTRIESQIAVGCVDDAEVNAFIIRSENNKNFAIVLNRALVTMTNHYVKLIAAALYPDAVILCNGKPGSGFKKAEYIRLSSEMLANYGKTGEPIGPELKIVVQSDAMKFLESRLQALHVFALAHEIGHYLNGDLESESNFFRVKMSPCGQVFGSENVSHNMEFKADDVAFEIVLRIWRSIDPKYPARQALDNSVTMFFNFLREVSNRGCESHPRSSDRILSVTNSFFGENAAVLMEKSFDDLSQLGAFQEMLRGLTVTELLERRATAHPFFAIK